MLAWAGADAGQVGFDRERLEGFLKARAEDLGTARQAPWSEWLQGLARTQNPSLRAWALARRVEAGDYGAYQAFRDALAEHVLGLTKPGSGRRDRIVVNPPGVLGLAMPDALQLDHGSPFWRSLRKTLEAAPERKLDAGLYTVWCYGTHPDQRDLILDLAAHIEAPRTVRNPASDPWNDPRFWIVLDWALAWGMEEDFTAIRQVLREGTPRDGFDRVARTVAAIPGYFSERPLPEAKGSLAGSALPTPKPTPVTMDFSQLRVRDQPPAPRYPEEAKGRKMMTILVMNLVVDAEGRPTSCRPAPGPWLGFFAPTGAAYGLRWRFHPAQLNGLPVTARFRLTMPFRLRD
jgi:hypothetical protein